MMTKYFIVAIGILVAINLATGFLLKKSWEGKARIEAQWQEEQRDFKEKISSNERVIAGLKSTLKANQDKILDLGKTNNALMEEKTKSDNRLNAIRSSLKERTLQKPEVTERAADIAIKKWMCDALESTSDKKC